MSIEKFPPPKYSFTNFGLIYKIKTFLTKRETSPVKREFYNSDGSRKFEFYELRGKDNFWQQNIRLSIKVGSGWASPMTVMTGCIDNKEQLFGLELETITEDSPMPWELFYYDYHTGGLKRKTGMWSFSIDQSVDEVREMAESLGFVYASELPEYVDFEKTAKEFMFQAKNLNFSNPVIYPKELLEQ